MSATQIKVFFADNFHDENSALQNYNDWFGDTEKGKFSLKDLYAQGWIINNVIKTSESGKNTQLQFFMEIPDDKYKKGF